MSNPRSINIDLVNAQQARRILDRLVGYKLSPFISQKSEEVFLQDEFSLLL